MSSEQRDFFDKDTTPEAWNGTPGVVGFYQPHIAVDYTGMILDKRTGELVQDPDAVSRTKQSFKEECDINTIVKRFEATGQIDHVNQAAARGVYEDLPSGLDLQAGLEMIRQAEEGFMALPAHVRAQFGNNAVNFVDYVDQATSGNAEYQEQLIKWGVATDNRPTPAPQAPETPPTEPPK